LIKVIVQINIPDKRFKNNLFKNMGVGRIFSRGATRGFFQNFSMGAKVGEICFFPLETTETTFLLKFSNSLIPFRRPCSIIYSNNLRNVYRWLNCNILSWSFRSLVFVWGIMAPLWGPVVLAELNCV